MSISIVIADAQGNARSERIDHRKVLCALQAAQRYRRLRAEA